MLVLATSLAEVPADEGEALLSRGGLEGTLCGSSSSSVDSSSSSSSDGDEDDCDKERDSSSSILLICSAEYVFKRNRTIGRPTWASCDEPCMGGVRDGMRLDLTIALLDLLSVGAFRGMA